MVTEIAPTLPANGEVETDVFARRLRQARLAAGLSLGQLAIRLRRPVTKQALSKFEAGKAKPSMTTLADLSDALGVGAAWLMSRPEVRVAWIGYRKHSTLPKGKQDSITAIASKRIEGELRLRALFGARPAGAVPTGIEAGSRLAAEAAAQHVRQAWGLGDGPISGLVETLEERGAVVLAWTETEKFDGLSGWANDSTPVVVFNAARGPDRVRFDAAHELGHLVIACPNPEADQEALAYRFAAALLVPRSAAIHELGERRQALSLPELGLLKQRWGLSMQGWARRALDCGIISQSAYRGINITFRTKGWHRQEPYQYEGVEEPLLFRRLLWRALGEGIVSRHEAREMLPGYDMAPEARLGDAELSLSDIARMGSEQHAEAVRRRPPVVDVIELSEWEQGTSSDLHKDE
jgi:Zn-dependent peptidase ImmA (M78 family)/transcriptional regulator with XRE-family HTH domain